MVRVVWVMLLFLSAVVQAAEPVPNSTAPTLPAAAMSSQLQDVKTQVMQLNRDLFLLEEDLLFPASTQLGIFVSMDAGVLMPLDAVELRMDDDKIGGYLYTQQQTQAIQRGALQRVYEGNLKSGEHTLMVVFTGKGPQDQPYRRAIEHKFIKATDPVWLEVKIIDDTKTQQPALEVKAWPSTH